MVILETVGKISLLLTEYNTEVVGRLKIGKRSSAKNEVELIMDGW
jgi:hypothetical protein